MSITGDILLEAGTNEVEILVFRLGDRRFGVNVAKVREVIRMQPTVDVPHKHRSVIGMFEVRGQVLTLIDLAAQLRVRETAAVATKEVQSDDPRSIVVTEFNGVQLGFLVDAVERIHRISWSGVLPVPSLGIGGGSNDGGVTTGVVDLGDGLVLLVDFESVANTVLDQQSLEIREVANEFGIERSSARVVIADDSGFMRQQIRGILNANGYDDVVVYENGAAAWNGIAAMETPPAAIVSDIEMPGMDGLHLTKRIREDGRFNDVPIILFSSLVSTDNAKKGDAVGATAQVPKPALADVVSLIDRVLTGRSIDDILERHTGSRAAA